jgi:hypothetical protein
MRLLVVAVLALASVGCSDDSKGTEFTLRGHVVGAQAGMQPPAQVTVESEDADRDDPGEPDRSGLMQVRVTSGGEFNEGTLEECNLDPNSVAVFWTEATDFDPPSAVEGDAFPTILQNRQVDIDGRAFAPTDENRDAGCALVADEVQVEGAAPATSAPAPAAPAATPTPAPSPVESPSPTVTPPFQDDDETEEPAETP